MERETDLQSLSKQFQGLAFSDMKDARVPYCVDESTKPHIIHLNCQSGHLFFPNFCASASADFQPYQNPYLMINSQFNPTLCTLLHNMLMKESHSSKSLPNPPRLFASIRKNMIRVLEDLCIRSQANIQTLFLATKLTDEVFCKNEFIFREIKLIVVTCFILAIKFQDHVDKVPPVSLLQNDLQNVFTSNEIVRAQQIIFHLLNYSLRRDTPLEFLQMFISLDFFADLAPSAPQVAFDTLLELRFDFAINFFSASEVAACIVAQTRSFFGAESWPASVSLLTGIHVSKLQDVLSIVFKAFKSSSVIKESSRQLTSLLPYFAPPTDSSLCEIPEIDNHQLEIECVSDSLQIKLEKIPKPKNLIQQHLSA